MDNGQKLSRRDFLRLSAVTAASAVVVACGPQTDQPSANQAAPTEAATAGPVVATTGPEVATTAPEAAATASEAATANAGAPGAFKEAPMLAELVQAGSLPPVEERLPANPYVPPHEWLTPGVYGGTMQLSSTDVAGTAIHQFMYGHSPLRYLKDGQEIGPGLAESWESNDDASEWTLHFREGLKWSDGHPWSVDDILYWWEDMVLNEEHPTGPPDEARSGTGTLVTLKKVDDLTLQMIFDAPAPLTADRLAVNVKRGNGADWMQPRHYAEQFHPKYNKDITGADWITEHDAKLMYRQNPESPTMTGWRVTSYKDGERAVWERNPYYWCVDQDGNQLPYIDRINLTNVQDVEIEKLGFLEGKVDYAQFHALTLADVQGLKAAQSRGKMEVRFWDSGSGTGSLFFFNYDFQDEKMRNLIRMPEFRKALSHAYNRADVQKSVYFNTGELTTGTYSPKAIEYQVNEEGKSQYATWRDSALKYDPEMAKSMLDEIGVVDKDGDGKREMPDGSKLVISIDFNATTGPEHINKNGLLARDWAAIGLDVIQNPMPVAAYDSGWRAGTVMSKSDWEVGNGPDHLTNATWLVPIEPTRWAPLEGQFYSVRGTPAETEEEDVNPWERKPPRLEPEAGGPIEQLWKLYDQAKVEPDAMKRHQLVWQMIDVHVEHGPFIIGTIANYPRIILVKEGLRNVPQREDLALGGFVNPWSHPVPAVYDTEAWYFDDPAAHS